VIEVIITFIIAGLGAFLGSYLKKKGENLATQEDLKNMTEKVEEIKTKFTTQIEELKSDLFLKTDTKSKYLTEKREAYLNLYSKLIYWYKLCIEFSLEEVYFPTKDIVKNIKGRLAEAKFQANYYSDIMLVYNEDKTYIDTVGKISMFVLSMQHFIEKLLDDILSYEDSAAANNMPRNDYYTGKSKIFENYRQTIKENSQALFTLRNTLTIMTTKMLQELN
jgi:hypothetical protein